MLFALAAQFSLPALTDTRVPDVRAVFSGNDVPAYLVDQGRVDLTVYTRTTVRPDGRIQNCVAETSSGDPRLDAYTCALIVKRAKFLPARWVDGSAAYGVIRMPVRWTVGDGPPPEGGKSNVPDLDLSVNHLPKGALSMVAVTLEIAADEKGRPLTCAEWPQPPNDHGKHFPELVPIACQEARASLVLSPPLDASGKPARSIQSVSVHFKLGQ
jgi:hypothetical protein